MRGRRPKFLNLSQRLLGLVVCNKLPVLIPSVSSLQLSSDVTGAGVLPKIGLPVSSGNCTNPVTCLSAVRVSINGRIAHSGVFGMGVFGGVGSIRSAMERLYLYKGPCGGPRVLGTFDQSEDSTCDPDPFNHNDS